MIEHIDCYKNNAGKTWEHMTYYCNRWDKLFAGQLNKYVLIVRI